LHEALDESPVPPDAAPTVPHVLGRARGAAPIADTEVAVPGAVSPPAAPGQPLPARHRPARRFGIALVALAVVVLVVLGVVGTLLLSDDGGSGGSPPPPTPATRAPSRPTTAGSVPPALDRALDRLDRAVSP
jgi:hypothetical protein